MGIVITPSPPIGVRPFDSQINDYQRISPQGQMMTDSLNKLLGGGFTSTLDTVEWVAATSGAGSSSAVAGTVAVLTSGTANSGFGALNSAALARFSWATGNMMRSVHRLTATGVANTTRVWGAFNFGVKPAILDGHFFSYDGSSSTLSVGVANAGVLTTVASGSFNGEVSSYTLDANAHTYEIVFQIQNSWLFIDKVLIHHFKSVTAPLIGNMHVAASSSSSNSVSGTTSASLEVWSHNILRMSSSEPQPQFFHISANGTNVIRLGPGTLQRVIINSPGSNSNIATIYDNTAGSGTIIGIINTSGSASATTLNYNLPFFTGLTIVTAAGTSADLTVVYD